MNIIMKDLIHLMNPKYIEVPGIFTPRGGISIYPVSYTHLDLCQLIISHGTQEVGLTEKSVTFALAGP